MITESVSRGTVCLRCRLRLLRQSTQPFQTSNRNRILRVRQSSLRYFTSESIPRSDTTPITDGDRDSPRDGQSEERDREPQGEQKYRNKRIHSRKRLLSGGRVLSPGVEDIDSGILGNPAHVIVMRDQGLFQKKSRLLISESPDHEPASQSIADIEALLDNQRKTPTVKEVHENIDSLRPETDTTLPERTFRKLQNRLTDGFLSVQLMAYLEAYKKNGSLGESSPQANTKQVKGAEQFPKYEWIKSVSPWVPLGDQQSITDGTDPSLYGYVTDSATAKAKLAVRIMRECWGLSIVELSAGLGETRVKIRNREFLLLMRGTRRGVDVMGKIQLGPGEKVEAFRNKKTLRLVTTKTKAFILIRSLGETLERMTTKSVPVQTLTSEPIDEAVLEELGRITNTHIRISKTTNRLHVTWIEPETNATQDSTTLEDAHEAVFRLLLTALNSKLVASSLSVAGLSDKHSHSGRFVSETTNKEKLGWRNRMRPWARYMLPLALEDDTSVSTSPFQSLPLSVEPQTGLLSSEPSGFDLEKEIIPKSPFPDHAVQWAEELKTATKAHFGHLLHANEPNASPPPLPHLLTANHPRAFAPITPHPVHLANFEMKDKSALVQTTTTVVIHFWPSPIVNTTINRKLKGVKKSHRLEVRTGTPPAPVLELRLTMLGGKVSNVESLRAIKQTHVTDVMLPASSTDMRFTQTQYTLLEGGSANLATWQPIVDFLKPAHLDLASDKLEVPSHQRFHIPGRMLTDSPASPSVDPNQMLSTQYTFVGLEVHRSVSVPYEGCKLTYTSIDAGPGGGRRAEVSLEPAFVEGSDIKADARKFDDDFLAICQNLARTDTFWSNYPSIHKIQPIGHESESKTTKDV